ncbi:carbamate kinase [Staphylococcus chromogenes]|uniref:Carbamate kinase n=1 Tax=Staphylococcus chromogenes TaxID=46126 RepID=A0AAX0ZFJ9_STACR|nr:carbamate kinase [Staphylococcus chromogenes]KDP12089.1 carbamate kinase [Staphylococcus chromogenes MU 970]MBV5138641.1 carbamate kinase [Staphylococcus chromogenes]MBW6089745.1 carbamate kinase [Staphylococcus chromogenes]MCD9060005.1 carbamate kinase [Staphylococcus chromogenes]MCD9062256.1 carbamate kinase [Staphylococcus chromogenes]
MAKTMVIALGGNAIQTKEATANSQQAAIRQTLEKFKPLFQSDTSIVMSHGNGPQIGNVLIQQAEANSSQTPAMPLDVCGAMTQGMIGYWLETETNRVLKKINSHKQVGTVITRVEVDPDDPRLSHPTKPIGPFYTKEDAQRLQEKELNSTYKEDAGRGFRKVVPSPLPVSILEHEMIKTLLEQDNIVIACGGGGIPVIRQSDTFEGIEAVIDKDFASEKLAELIEADTLMILTAVPNVFVNFNTPKQQALTDVDVATLKTYVDEGQFSEGSMLPKIEAAINFIGHHPHREVIITDLDNAFDALEKGTGTHIHL